MGNGDMTVVGCGPSDDLCFHIGKSDFWTDGHGWSFTNEHYDRYTVSPITVGGLRLRVRDMACATYRQEVDLLRACVTGTFAGQGSTLHTRAWCAATANVMVVELTAHGPMPIGIRVQTFAKDNADPRAAVLPTTSGHEEDAAWVTRETWNRGRWVSRAALATRIWGTPSRSWTHDDRRAYQAIVIEPGQSAIIACALAGGKDANNHLEDAQTYIASLSPDAIEELRSKHDEWWRNYWSKSLIDLGGDAIECFWYGSQYALACCTRSGHTCPGIFGFATDDHPRWNGDYHLNYNAQQPFAGVFSSNRGELAQPLIDAMNDFIPEGLRRAKGDLKPPQAGLYMPIGLGPWGVVAQDDYMGQKCAAAFAAVPHVDHFHYQQDLSYTRHHLYPFVREAARFWEGFLKREGERYVIQGSAAHEHGGEDSNTALDLVLVRRLFRGLIAMSEALNTDAESRDTWRHIVDNLAPYPTTTHQGRTVFKQSENAAGFSRSITLMNLAWPGCGDIGFGGDPHLTKIMRDTLDAIDRWDQGNSFAWVMIAAVRTAHPDAYQRFVDRLTGPGGLRDNLTLAQAYGGIETCGATLAVNEMLLQSSEGVLRLFPVWPRHRDAAFQNLRAHGGVLVSAALRDGGVTSLSLKPAHTSHVRLLNPWPQMAFSVHPAPEGSGSHHLPDRHGIIHLHNLAPTRYHLQPIPRSDVRDGSRS